MKKVHLTVMVIGFILMTTVESEFPWANLIGLAMFIFAGLELKVFKFSDEEFNK